MLPFPCLGSANYSVFALKTLWIPLVDIPASCKDFRTISVPVRRYGDIRKELTLMWFRPFCKSCEEDGKTCGFKSDDGETSCIGSSNSEHNVDFHQIVDFIEASNIRYALTINLTVYVSHIRRFWSTARIKTTNEGTKILATVDGKPRTISESSIRRNLKLKDEEGISTLPDAELFENLALMGYNILPNQKFTFQKDLQRYYSAVSLLFLILSFFDITQSGEILSFKMRKESALYMIRSFLKTSH
nr:zinc finger, RING/FYVE/PHD-type [Tanacetum cinerariifolium]